MDLLTKAAPAAGPETTGQMRKPRVLVIGEMSGVHLEAWIHPLKADFDFHVLTMHDCGHREDGIVYHRAVRPLIGRLSYLPWFLFVQLITWKVRPDIVYISFLSSYGLAPVFVSFKCPLVLSVWGTDVNSLVNGRPVIRYLARKSLQKYDRINAPAAHMKEKMVRSLGADRSKIEVFQYGVEVGGDGPPRPRPTGGGGVKIASIRNWAPWYRVDQTVAGFIAMVEDGRAAPDDELHLFGGGSAEDTHTVVELIKSSPRAEAQIVLHGNLNRPEFNRKVAGCDLFISVPDTDGLSLAVLEACARGCYPILSEIDANTEWFKEQDAVFAETCDAAGLADAMTRACVLAREQPAVLADGVRRNLDKVLSDADYHTNTRRLGDMLSAGQSPLG